MALIKIEDLAVPEQELSSEEMAGTSGGWVRWRFSGRQYTYRYRTVTRRVRQRVRYYRDIYKAYGFRASGLRRG